MGIIKKEQKVQSFNQVGWMHVAGLVLMNDQKCTVWIGPSSVIEVVSIVDVSCSYFLSYEIFMHQLMCQF